jgi:serine/threonine protein kinase
MQLVLGQGHFKGVDYWAIGVLLYEMVSGHSPFYDPANNDQMVICKNIVKGKFSFPSHVKDKEVKDIVTKLLTRTVTNRLGCRKAGSAEIREHKFFAPLDWAALVGRKLKAPWVPPLKDPFDTSCFDKVQPPLRMAEDYIANNYYLQYEGPEDIQPYVDDGKFIVLCRFS